MSDICGDKCLICGGKAEVSRTDNINFKFITCEICGRVYYNTYEFNQSYKIDKSILSSYLFYDGINHKPTDDDRFFFVGLKEVFDKIHEKYPLSKYISREECEAWYPKTFSEKVDMILLGLAKLSKYDGNIISLKKESANRLFFVNLENTAPYQQYKYMCDFLMLQGFIKEEKQEAANTYSFSILPQGLMRIDMMQKSQVNNRNVFLAMSFSDDMKDIRETIKKAIIKAGYLPRIMDEIEHNHQIVPEMLYEIRNSKFLIAELTNHNNGAYFEAGYALGHGKEVIQLCKKDTFGKDGHFDVKQVNTVLWDSEDDLYEKLIKRIESTI